MKNGKNNLKKTDILLLVFVIFLSMTTVRANTNLNKITLMNPGESINYQSSSKSYVIWDNNLTYGELLIACQYEPTYGELGSCADDFILDSTTDIMEVRWIGGFYNGYPAPFDWQITFYNDDGTGTKPGTIYAGPFLFLNADCHEVFLEQAGNTYYYEWMVYIPDVNCIGNVKYWIEFQGQGIFPPQSGMAVHSSPQQMHECKFKSAYYGYPDWVDGSYVFGNIYDLAFQLSSWCHDDIPPVTTCNVTGTNPVTIILIATDECTGVYYTTYKLDDGAWTNYTAAFVVSEVGDHIIYYYSVDFAGNIEKEKNTSFTVQAPPISIAIAIQGGFGVSVIIKNTGTINLTNVPYTIELDGKLIFVGKTVNDTIATLATGKEVKIRDFVFGFGKIGITVTSGGVEANAEGTVFLFFVIGVT